MENIDVLRSSIPSREVPPGCLWTSAFSCAGDLLTRERPNVRHDLKTEPGRTEPNLQTERSVRFGKLPTLVRFGLVRFGKNPILVRFGSVWFGFANRAEPYRTGPKQGFSRSDQGVFIPAGDCCDFGARQIDRLGLKTFPLWISSRFNVHLFDHGSKQETLGGSVEIARPKI